MKINIAPYVSVVPRTLPSNAVCSIRIEPKYNFTAFNGCYSVTVFPRFEFPYSGKRQGAFYEPTIVFAQDGILKFDYKFENEQEYIIQVKPEKEKGKNVQVVETSVYALADDLYSKKVMKGDLHLHTTFSDGLESPEHRAVQARKTGFDFIAITDHNGFHGSKYLIEKMKHCPHNMVFLHGEEVHATSCPVHILSLGAASAIAPLVTNIDDKQRAKLDELMKKYKDVIGEGVDADAFVAAMDVFNKIHETGGLSVLCHIYWDAVDGMNHKRMGAPEYLINALVDNCQFDAFEITSGAPKYDLKANYLQETYYREKLPKNFPIIGITDSHTTLNDMTIFGGNYTIVFSDNCSETAIIDAIRQSYSVSVDGVSDNVICHGSLRLIKYATFLVENYFPQHDQVVNLEGQLMQRILDGNHSYINILEKAITDNKQIIKKEWKIYE